MEEIEKKNDFNLNISRYVSTAKPEVMIDLNEVNKDLQKLEEDIKGARNEHNKFVKELGLPLTIRKGKLKMKIWAEKNQALVSGLLFVYRTLRVKTLCYFRNGLQPKKSGCYFKFNIPKEVHNISSK